MAAKVVLEDIVEALEMQIDEHTSFLNLETGEVETLPDGLVSDAEEDPDDPPDLSDWQKGDWEIAKRIAGGGPFRHLPSKFDVHEWSIMDEFCRSLTAPDIRDEILDAIHGRGAFRNFKRVVHTRGIEQSWYDFRDQALRQIAIDWCEEHGIEWRHRQVSNSGGSN